MEVMELNLMDANAFIKKYKNLEVTSARILTAGNEINEAGLFSTEIFGNFGSPERLSSYGFIKLHGEFLNPLVYNIFIKMNKKINGIILNEDFYKLNDKGELELDNKHGTLSGLSLIKNNFEAIKELLFKDTGTKTRQKYLDFLSKFGIKDLFMDTIIVIPAGLRDINVLDFDTSGTINYEPVNDLYLDLLRLTAGYSSTKDDTIAFNIQVKLLEIHNFFTVGGLSGKTGLLQSKSLKRPIAYAVRSVIISSDKTVNEPNASTTNNIRLGQVGIPVSVLIDQFYKFVVHEVRNFYNNAARPLLRDFLAIQFVDKIATGKMTDTEYIELFLDKCINDSYFLKLEMGKIEGKYPIYVMDFLKNEIMFPIVGTPDAPKRFTTATRYPITNQFSVQILQVLPYTTDKVEVITLKNGLTWEMSKNLDSYSGAVRMNDLSLKAFGGDYDGGAHEERLVKMKFLEKIVINFAMQNGGDYITNI